MAKIKHDKLLKIKIKHIQYIYNTVKKNSIVTFLHHKKKHISTQITHCNTYVPTYVAVRTYIRTYLHT